MASFLISGLCWNLRGLRNHATFLALCDLVRIFSLLFLFLYETKISQKKVKDL